MMTIAKAVFKDTNALKCPTGGKYVGKKIVGNVGKRERAAAAGSGDVQMI